MYGVGDSAGGTLAAAVALRLRDSRHPVKPRLQVLIYPNLQAVDFTLPSYVSADTVYGSTDILVELSLMYMAHQSHCAKALIDGSQHRVSRFASYRHVLPNDTRTANNSQQDVQPLSLGTDTVVDATLSSGGTSTNQPLDDVTLAEARACDDIVQSVAPYVTNGYVMPLMAASVSDLPHTYVVTAQYDVLRDDGLLYAHRLREAGVPVTLAHYEGGYHGIWAFIYGPIWTAVGQKCFDDSVQYVMDHL